MLETIIITLVGIGIIAFFAEYCDSTHGMGYGTILTPVLMLCGFSPMVIVPSILLSEFITGILAGFTHHSVGNVDFLPRTMKLSELLKKIKEYGVIFRLKEKLPLHLKIVLILFFCSLIGSILSAYLATTLPPVVVKIYIYSLIVTSGIVLLMTHKEIFGFSFKKVVFLGVVAAFNKGISGGGYGPVVTSGQIMTGVNPKNAVGVTSLAEGLTCLTAICSYFIFAKDSLDL
jgi:uncharacterized membrane protein YfcA